MSNNSVSMADVSGKAVTHRKAVARGTISLGPIAYQMTRDGTLPKGDAQTMAKIAGIMAAKKTPELIPLCHPISLNRVVIDFEFDDEAAQVSVLCMAEIDAKTGVEMEALTGCSQALLTLWDLNKPIESDLSIDRLVLLYKRGGKQGDWQTDQCDLSPAALRLIES